MKLILLPSFLNKKVNKKRSDYLLVSLFLLPSIIFISIVIIYPLFKGLSYSLYSGTLFKNGNFVGINNFLEIIQMRVFWNAMRFSLLFALFNVLGSYIIGLLIALFLENDVPGRNIFRALILTPWIIPSVVSIVAWRWTLGNQDNVINQLFSFLGMAPVSFLSTTNGAFFSLCLVKIWRSFPFMMVSLLAGLKTIPEDLYEAVELDGANNWQKFSNITWPQLLPITVVCGILMTVWSVNDFDTIFLLTNGGPLNSTQNMITLAYKYAFVKNSIGISSAMAVIAMIVLMIIAAISVNLQRRMES